MSRTHDVIACVREELRDYRDEIDGDCCLRSLGITVKFHPHRGTVRSVECQRFSERHPGAHQPHAYTGSRADVASGVLQAEILRRQPELDSHDVLRQISVLLKYEDDGTARVVLFESATALRTDRVRA